MSKTELIDDHVSAKQCKLAVNALLDHAVKVQQKKQETELLADKEQNVWLVVTVKQMHPEKKLKPHRIPLAHPLVDPRTSPVCLITKDPQREYKDLLEKHGIRFISRVVGIEKLKGKFKPFEARRMLLKENGLFLADDRVTRLLPGLLGKKFFEAKKQPIPVSLTKKDLKGELERAISSTYFHQNLGTCVSVKIGVVSQTPTQVLANLETALPAIIKNIKGEWDNVQSLHIKTNSSASLPIWTCNLGSEEGGRWDGLVASLSDAADSEDDISGDDDEEMRIDEEELKALKADAGALKGKKRAAEGEVEKPKKKKAKAGPQTVSSSEKATSSTEEVRVASKPVAEQRAAVEEVEKPKKKKKTKTGSDAVQSSEKSATSSEVINAASKPAVAVAEQRAAEEKPKKKKGKAGSESAQPSEKAIPSTEADKVASKPAVAVTEQEVKKSKKKAKAGSETAQSSEKVTPSTKAATAASEPAVTAAEPELQKTASTTSDHSETPEVAAVGKRKKSKKGSKASVDAAPAPSESEVVIPSLTTEELKEKLSTPALGKKKVKLSKDKSAAKSAKEGVLGKKRV